MTSRALSRLPRENSHGVSLACSSRVLGLRGGTASFHFASTRLPSTRALPPVLCARRWCTGAGAGPNRHAELITSAHPSASVPVDSVKPVDSPFASFHPQRSSTSRRWEWETADGVEGASPAPPAPAEDVASETKAAGPTDTPTDSIPSDCSIAALASDLARGPPPKPAAEGDVKRMSLTIRSPQQRVHDRQRDHSTPPRSHTASDGATSTPAHGESPEAVLRRRARMPENESQIPATTLHPGTSYAASNTKPFHSRLTVHPHRGVARFTEPVKRIVLLRNGVSEANEDISAYVRTPDWRIPLTQEGRTQCVASGRQLADLVGDEPVYFYYSPYIRSRQSLRYVLEGYDQRRLETLSGSAAERLQWWERGDGDEQCMSRAVNEATSGTGVSDRGVSDPSAADSLAGQHPTLASLSSAFTTTGTVGASSKYLTSDANRDAAVAAAQAAMRDGNGRDVPPSTDTAATPTPSPSATSGSAHNQVLPTGPSLVLRSGTLNHIIGVREDVRLRDGDIGRYSDLDALLYHLREREEYGRFFYRFPFGESGADVCDRVTSFLDAFQRERVDFPMDTNVVIITHGLTIRMFIKRWFHLTVDTFHRMQSPPSASLCTLTRLHHQSAFRLDENCVDAMMLPQSLNEHNGYKYRNKRLLGSMSTGAPYM